MSNSQNNAFLNTVDRIFANNSTVDTSKNPSFLKNKKINKRELELSLTVLLVELASCDEKFHPEEYHIIANGLKRLFGTTREQVQALVNQATQVLRNLRGTGQFAAQLKENLTEESRMAIMEVIEDIIHADGVIEGFEVYFKHKISDMLGLPKQPLVPLDS